MTIDELQVLITANTTQLKKEINAIQSNLSSVTKSTNKFSTSMTKSFLKSNLIMKTVSLGIRAIGTNIDSAIQRADTLNNFSKVMGNLGVSTDDADVSIARLSDKLTGLPTTLDAAVSAVQNFTAANGNVKASTDMFLALNNAILAGGANQQIQASALEQLSQAYAKGKPDMMEWRTAMTAMPAQLKQVAMAMGYVSASQLGEELRNGNVSMNEFLQTVHKLNTEGLDGFASFEEQARNSTGGIQTSITNVKTAITRGIADIINAIGRSNIAGFFQNVAKAISNAVPYVTAFVKACIWAVNSVSQLFGGGTVIDTKAAGNAVDNVNNSVKNLDNSNKAAGKSAEKMKKTLASLAGFDEMNVLTEKNADSADSDATSSGGTIPNWDTSGWETATSNVTSKVNELTEKMKEVLKLAGSIGLTIGAWKIAKTVADFFLNPGNIGLFKMIGELTGVSDVLDALTLSDKFTSLGGAIATVAGAVTLAYGTFDAWINGLDWGNMALMVGGLSVAVTGLYFAIKPFSTTLAPIVAGIAAVAGGLVLVVTGVKDFISNGATLQNTIMIIGGAIAIAVGLATAGLSVLVSAIIGATAAVGAFVAAILLEDPAIMSVEEAQENLTAAKERAREAENNYISAVDAAEASMKKLEEAEKAAGITGEELYAQVQSGTLDYADMTDAQKEVYKAYLDNEQKQKDLKAATEQLNAAKKAETLASYENQLALAKESGNYDDFKKSVVDAFEKGELSADEARDLISKSMSEMSNDAQKTFMTDLPDSLKNGLDPHKYESTGTQIKKWFGDLWQGIKNVFSAVGTWFSDLFTGAWNGIKNAFSSVASFFSGIWNNIKNAFSAVGTWFSNLFTGAWNGIKSAFSSVASFFGNVWANIKNAFSSVKTWFSNLFTGAWNGVKSAFSSVVSFFSGIWGNIKNAFSSVKTWFGNIFSGAWTNIKNAFSSVTSFFTGIWTKIKNVFSNVGETIAGAVSGTVKKAINAVLSTAVKIINGFISAINLAIGLINKIPGVEISKLDKLEVPKLARGGVVDKPTLAMVGEAGTEAVVPLERNLGYLDKLAGMLADKIGGGAGGFNLVVKLGEDTIFDKFIDYSREKAFETNGEVVFA